LALRCNGQPDLTALKGVELAPKGRALAQIKAPGIPGKRRHDGTIIGESRQFEGKSHQIGPWRELPVRG